MAKNLCSFRYIAGGGKCGADSRDTTRNCDIVNLQSCLEDISEHKRQYQVFGVETEIELIRGQTFSMNLAIWSISTSVLVIKQFLAWDGGARI
jgi:hypothetical protein